MRLLLTQILKIGHLLNHFQNELLFGVFVFVQTLFQVIPEIWEIDKKKLYLLITNNTQSIVVSWDYTSLSWTLVKQRDLTKMISFVKELISFMFFPLNVSDIENAVTICNEVKIFTFPALPDHGLFWLY